MMWTDNQFVPTAAHKYTLCQIIRYEKQNIMQSNTETLLLFTLASTSTIQFNSILQNDHTTVHTLSPSQRRIVCLSFSWVYLINWQHECKMQR